MNKPGFSLLYILLIFSIATSCIGFKKKASKNGKSYYETFFVNDSTLQYFIKPINFSGQVDLNVDFTFRKIKTQLSDVTMNFTVSATTASPLKKVYLVAVDSINKNDIKLLFKEKKKKKFEYRYSTTISYSKLNSFFSQNNASFTFNDDALLPTPKSQKIINELNQNLFNFELKE